MIEKLLDHGLQLTNPYARAKEGPLEGLTFAFTGSLERWAREEVEQVVERLGGGATSSVSGQTDYIVAGPGAGSKLDEAHERNIPAMDEEEFIEFLEDRGEKIT